MKKELLRVTRNAVPTLSPDMRALIKHFSIMARYTLMGQIIAFGLVGGATGDWAVTLSVGLSMASRTL